MSLLSGGRLARQVGRAKSGPFTGVEMMSAGVLMGGGGCRHV